MIETIGTILVWLIIVFGGIFGLLCAVIGFAFLINYKR